MEDAIVMDLLTYKLSSSDSSMAWDGTNWMPFRTHIDRILEEIRKIRVREDVFEFECCLILTLARLAMVLTGVRQRG